LQNTVKIYFLPVTHLPRFFFNPSNGCHRQAPVREAWATKNKPSPFSSFDPNPEWLNIGQNDQWSTSNWFDSFYANWSLNSFEADVYRVFAFGTVFVLINSGLAGICFSIKPHQDTKNSNKTLFKNGTYYKFFFMGHTCKT